ncbi:DUF4861 family protein [Danxiaibacter flavus]|uniref:DUF4861 family protein n=1 Tax=Danxiaibacter flavus TaxID=3049108 RepID=A0ABV3ZLA7_9BACT|nr:DUF4861 family protein [Chitinophagaceae bacterium DXS]
MNKLFLSLLTFLWMGTNAQSVGVTITNNSQLDYSDYVIEVPWKDIVAKWPSIDTADFKVIDSKTQQEITFQLEYAGNPTIQNLLLQVSIPANKTRSFKLVKGKHAFSPPKTFCRYVPERKDDFAWENDKIAFRMYGKALEGSNEDAYGLDVWVKSTDKLVVDDRYKKNDYHKDHGDGLDYYQVGYTLGAGNIAPYVNDSVYYSKNYHRFKVLDNGPLRSSFQLIYDEWNVDGKPVSVIKTISIDAGSQLNRVTAAYNHTSDAALPVATGLAKRKDPGVLFLNEQNGISAYWEPQHGNDGVTGVATIHLQPIRQMLVTKEQVLTITTTDAQKSITYFTGAVWNKANRITSAHQWFEYVQHFQQKLKQPLIITVQ